ncbi:hypothetical protein BKA93DRAFT_133226 [Sparassis latifolia]
MFLILLFQCTLLFALRPSFPESCVCVPPLSTLCCIDVVDRGAVLLEYNDVERSAMSFPSLQLLSSSYQVYAIRIPGDLNVLGRNRASSLFYRDPTR